MAGGELDPDESVSACYQIKKSEGARVRVMSQEYKEMMGLLDEEGILKRKAD